MVAPHSLALELTKIAQLRYDAVSICVLMSSILSHHSSCLCRSHIYFITADSKLL